MFWCATLCNFTDINQAFVVPGSLRRTSDPSEDPQLTVWYSETLHGILYGNCIDCLKRGCNLQEILYDILKKAKFQKIVQNREEQSCTVRQQNNIAFQLFMKSQSPGIQLDLRELQTYLVTLVLCNIGTADGFIAKTDKSKSFSHLTKDVEDATPPQTVETLIIIDCNACFHQLKELPGNFSQICS